MIVSLIVAMDEKGGISQKGQLPWRLPAELKLFKQTTMGHHLLMGRKTFESVGKPLPGRTTIVITRQEDYQAEDCLIAHSLEAGLAIAQSRGESEIFICGGGKIYALALSQVDRIYLTVVHTVASTDMIFPIYDPTSWHEIAQIHHPADVKNPFAFTRKVLEKKTVTKVDNP
jgi:dihydrofolate reductase